MHKDFIRLRGAFQIALCDRDGNVLEKQIVDNTVVTVGRAWVLKQLNSVNHVTQQNLSHIGIGSGLSAPATGDAALGNEVTRAAIGTFTTSGLTDNPPNLIMAVSFATSDANTTLGEIAVFNSNAAGTMLARATFASFVKATSNTLGLSYTISS